MSLRRVSDSFMPIRLSSKALRSCRCGRRRKSPCRAGPPPPWPRRAGCRGCAASPKLGRLPLGSFGWQFRWLLGDEALVAWHRSSIHSECNIFAVWHYTPTQGTTCRNRICAGIRAMTLDRRNRNPRCFPEDFPGPIARPAASLSSARSHSPSTCARREKFLLRKTRARCVFSLFHCTCRQAVRPPCRKAANLSKLVQAIRLQFGSQQFLKRFEKNKKGQRN